MASSASARTGPNRQPAPKLRSACDNCHRGKTKCSGERPCRACLKNGKDCVYSAQNKIGRPKGSKTRSSLLRGNPPGEKASAATTSRADVDQPLDQSVNIQMNGDGNVDLLPGLESYFVEQFGNARNGGQDAEISHPSIEQTEQFSLEHILNNIGVPHPTATPPTRPQALPGQSQTPQSMPDAPCTCHRNQIRLLFHMLEVEKAQKRASTPDTALAGARQAMAFYSNLMSCANCARGGNEGTFVLFALSARFLLRALKGAFQVSSSSLDAATGTLDAPLEDDLALLTGPYIPSPPEQATLTRALVVMAVERVEGTLPCLYQRLRERRPDGTRKGASVDLFLKQVRGYQRSFSFEGFEEHVQSMLGTVEDILQYR